MSVGFEEERKRAHEIRLISREQMIVSGVEEVLSFDEEGVRLKSSEGELFVEGKDIKIGALDTQGGTLSLCGRINAIYYAGESNDKKGFFSRLMR
jgi:sporulation protein YabP